MLSRGSSVLRTSPPPSAIVVSLNTARASHVHALPSLSMPSHPTPCSCNGALCRCFPLHFRFYLLWKVLNHQSRYARPSLSGFRVASLHSTSNFQLRTQNPELKTQNSELIVLLHSAGVTSTPYKKNNFFTLLSSVFFTFMLSLIIKEPEF